MLQIISIQNFIKLINNFEFQAPTRKRKERRKIHTIHYRPQLRLTSDDLENQRKKEQRISAALALYHSYKPLKNDGQLLSFKEFSKVFVTHPLMQSLCKNSLSIKVKKLTNTQLKRAKTPPETPARTPVTPAPTEIQTKYGRQVKPVLVNLVNIKPKIVENNVKKCQKSEKSPQLITQTIENKKNSPTFHCDICYRRFAKRTRMIRHIKNVHSADIHRVDLNKFVLPRTKIQSSLKSWTSMIEL